MKKKLTICGQLREASKKHVGNYQHTQEYFWSYWPIISKILKIATFVTRSDLNIQIHECINAGTKEYKRLGEPI